MNVRILKVLTVIAGILALGEFGSSIMIWKENYPGSLPMAAVVFGVFFVIAAWLLRSGRVTAGAIFAGLLCLFEVVICPWLCPAQRPGTGLPDGFRPGVAGRADRGHHGAGRAPAPPGRGLTSRRSSPESRTWCTMSVWTARRWRLTAAVSPRLRSAPRWCSP